MRLRCELCNAEAAVFCPSDAALLCWCCDAKVHQANFLVARHLRRALCSTCNTFKANFVGFRPSAAAVCPSCRPDGGVEDNDSDSHSSVCISTTTSPAKEYSGGRRSDYSCSSSDHLKVEGIFVKWCCKLGVEAGGPTVESACRAVRSVDGLKGLPFRVILAASMWLGLRLNLQKSALSLKFLKRLEGISGVPAKIILAAGAKLGRALRRPRLDLQEGWAEC